MTRSANFQELPEFVWGQEFEIALSHYLQHHGWGILPVYNYSGGGDDKPPLLEMVDGPVSGGGLVMPDMLGAKDGHSKFLEAKRKTRADYTRLTQRLETGFSRRLYEHYRLVEAQSGLPVWAFFGHDTEDEVRFCRLASTPIRTYRGQRMGPHGMVYFAWDTLTPLAAMSEVMSYAERTP